MNLLGDAYAMLGRHLRSSVRMPVWVVVELIQPAIWLVLYGQLFRSVALIPGFTGGSYIQFLMPGIVVMDSLFGAAWAGMGILTDLDRGVLDRLLTTPASRTGIILARVLHSAVVVAVQTVVVVVIALMVGARLGGGVEGAVLLLVVAMLEAAGFAAASNGLTLLVRREETFIAVLNLFTLPLTFLSATLMSQSLMPGWMRAAARFNPVNWAAHAARLATSRPAALGPALPYLLPLAGFALVAGAFATWAFSVYRRAT